GAITKGESKPRDAAEEAARHDSKASDVSVTRESPETGEEGARVGTPGAATARVEWIGSAELFRPLPPPRWTVPGLQIGPGRPSMLAAYGYFGKTLAAQSMALSIASGAKVWGQFSTSGPARV